MLTEGCQPVFQWVSARVLRGRKDTGRASPWWPLHKCAVTKQDLAMLPASCLLWGTSEKEGFQEKPQLWLLGVFPLRGLQANRAANLTAFQFYMWGEKLLWDVSCEPGLGNISPWREQNNTHGCGIPDCRKDPHPWDFSESAPIPWHLRRSPMSSPKLSWMEGEAGRDGAHIFLPTLAIVPAPLN